MKKLKAYLGSYNAQVAQRVFIATVLGYVLANLLAIVLSYVLPLPIKESAELSTLLSFVFYAVIIMWVFSQKNLAGVWRNIMIAIAISGVITFLHFYFK